METPEIDNLVKKFLQFKLTIAFAESCTAGLLASEFSKGVGSSEVLLGSVVTYHPLAKHKLLGVSQDSLSLYTAESQQVTNEMVMGLHKKLPADMCVAITGLCGAGTSEADIKPVGTMFFTFLHQNHAEEVRQEFEGDCVSVREQAVDFIFTHLGELLERYSERYAAEAVETRTKKG
ncbi:nicotinamide-nucleotide amidohydrolase family protein [Hymenobacter sp. GOD-10R]|uniref:CinA family protein n=1 Tax=Hymenobacter sp. GOD-10R TaxID=3093922 RepID=UPI002D785F80|nr:nicotinamide-nucleotide amidohydrolase family protein [Hymenobacter sp. GOD-10R]WRQ27312.1 nicotinamide-nucleotide amidohydrolase family protein [Hymenobacter sp. GOD-10R]